MNNIEVIAEYREQKQKMEALEIQARKEMQDRYSLLLTEAGEIQRELKASFGVNPELPSGVKLFALCSAVPVAAAPKKPGFKIGGLRRSLAAAIKKQDGAKVDEIVKQLAELGVTDTGLIPGWASTPVAEVE